MRREGAATTRDPFTSGAALTGAREWWASKRLRISAGGAAFLPLRKPTEGGVKLHPRCCVGGSVRGPLGEPSMLANVRTTFCARDVPAVRRLCPLFGSQQAISGIERYPRGQDLLGKSGAGEGIRTLDP